jgi:hypothetical protein
MKFISLAGQKQFEKREAVSTSAKSLFSLMNAFYMGRTSGFYCWSVSAGRTGFDPPLTSASRPALGPTQPPAQWVPGGSLSGGKARPGRDADHSPPSSAGVKKE